MVILHSFYISTLLAWVFIKHKNIQIKPLYKMTWKYYREVFVLTMMSIQRLLAKVREHGFPGFPELCRHVLTIVLIKTMFTTLRRVLELNLQCFSYLAIKSPFLGFEYSGISPFESRFTGIPCKITFNKNQTRLKNSETFVNKARNWTIEADEVQVSYDVVNLYPSVLVKEATDVIIEIWNTVRRWTKKQNKVDTRRHSHFDRLMSVRKLFSLGK